MTRTKYKLRPPTLKVIIGSTDTTLSGSRNSLTPVLFWKYLSEHSDERLDLLAYQCFQLAKKF
jgi:hypothetical protein